MSRGSFIASILAAAGEGPPLPSEWARKTTLHAEIQTIATDIARGGRFSVKRDVDGAQGHAAKQGGQDRAPVLSRLSNSKRRLSNSKGRAGNAKGRAGNLKRHNGNAKRRFSNSKGRVGNSKGCIAHSNHTTSNATRPPSHPDDVAALRALYLATGGDRWIRNACWLNASVPVCWWDQVLCDTKTWRVRELRLASNNLVGFLPSKIASLTSLQVLQLFWK